MKIERTREGNKMARNYQRDYAEIVDHAKKFKDKTTYECIEAYAAKRKIVFHRAGHAFWGNVDDGNIAVVEKNGLMHVV